MDSSPPPWALLTKEDISRRLDELSTSLSSSSGVRLCFSRDAVFSSGSETIDRLLPDGGVACGTVLEIFGPPAVGKSRLVREMVATFAARGCVEWTPRTAAGADMNDEKHQQQQGEPTAGNCGETIFRPCDWCVFFLLSDPSSFSLRDFYDALKNRLISELANSVCYGDEVETLLLKMQQKVKVVSFASPNDLLVFFRFLSNVEYGLSKHHANRRRVLVVVDNLSRLWEHPSCGATNHARQWLAAALVREMRNSIVIGNGWRNDVRCGKVECFQRNCEATTDGLQNCVDVRCGGVAVVLVNGCTNMYYCRPGATPLGPLGGPVWCAAAADFRLYVEPFFNRCVVGQYCKGDGSDVQWGSGFSGETKMQARLVKGGGVFATNKAVVV